MAASKTLSPPRRQPLAQQTFAFWQAAEDAPPLSVAKKTAVGVPNKPAPRVANPLTQATPAGKLSGLCHSGASTVPAIPLPAGKTPQSEGRVGLEHRSAVVADRSALVADRSALMAELRGRAAAIAANPAMDSATQFSTGSRALDACLPGGGLKRGWLCEWVAGHDASGASTLAMLAAASTMTNRNRAAKACETDDSASPRAAEPHRGPIIIVDPSGTFHAAGAIACGILPQRMVVCRPNNRRDSVWAIDQALRCSSVAAVWCALPWNFDDRDARRLQLAAEEGRTPGLFVLPSSARTRPSFAAVRWHVAAVPVDASRLSADQRVAAGLPLRPPLDLRVLCVSLDRARNFDHGSNSQQAHAANSGLANSKLSTFLAVTPDARLHPLTSAAVANLQRLQQLPTLHTPAEHRHEAAAVPLAARLADPTSTHSRVGVHAPPSRRNVGASRAG